MKKIFFSLVACLSVMSLTACGVTQGERAASGALIGAGTGAVVGGVVSGRPGGALVGAAAGAAGGALIGAATSPRHCARIAYDYDGNRVCVEFYD